MIGSSANGNYETIAIGGTVMISVLAISATSLLIANETGNQMYTIIAVAGFGIALLVVELLRRMVNRDEQ